MARAYFGSRISANMITTPEGYLVCKNVPIARIGHQEYLGSEFGAEHPGQMYDITRSEQEVFDKAAVASFEGKPVVDEHPSEDLTPENYSHYLKGVCREVHRGEGELQNCLVGDLIIYDAGLIDKIKKGKREISCGYDCLWCQTGDRSFAQKEIRGNHIAVVDKGRAGHKVAIRDSAAKRRKTMKGNNIFARMFAAFARDEANSPEDILEAAKLAGTGDGDPRPAPPPAPAPAPVHTPAPPPAPPKPAIDADLDARLKRIEDALEGLKPSAAPAPADEPDALDDLEDDLTNTPTHDEDDVVVDPDVINQNTGDDDGDELPEDDDPRGLAAINSSSRDDALKIIRNLRPVIAGLPTAQRKAAADSLARVIRGQVAQDSGYAVLQNAQRASRAHDSKTVGADYGRSIRDKYNPHYKN